MIRLLTLMLVGALGALSSAASVPRSEPAETNAAGSVASGEGWTNVAGNVSFGAPVSLTRTDVTLSNATRVVTLKRSIFPVSEQRRMVLAFATSHPTEGAAFVRLPPKVESAIAGAGRRIEVSKSRTQKGFKTAAQDAEYRAMTERNLADYLEKQVKSGVITQEELDIWRGCQKERKMP